MSSESLFLRLTDAADVSWIVLDDQGRRLTRTEHGPLSGARAAPGRRIVVLVPGRDVISTRAKVPVKSAARLRQMVPYSLEESVAQDVDTLLFAVGARTAADEIAVSIIAHEKLQTWIDRLHAEGIVANEICSEADGVPDTPGALTLVLEGERVYGRPSGGVPFVLEGLGLKQVLGLLHGDGEAADAAARSVQVYADRAAYEHFETELAELRGELANLDVKLLEDGPLAHFAASLAARPGTNLLQGPYAPRSDWIALTRPWRAAAVLLTAYIGVTLVGMAGEYFVLRSQDETLTERLADGCQRNVGTARLSACRTEVDRRLAAAGDTTDSEQDQFLATLLAIAESRDASSRITALSYRPGVVDIRLVAPSVPTLDEFARKMNEGKRFDVRIQSATPVEDGVEGQLQVVGNRS
jgi:general secretion pathway protein L